MINLKLIIFKKINIELPKYKLIKKYSSIEKDLKEFDIQRSVIVSQDME